MTSFFSQTIIYDPCTCCVDSIFWIRLSKTLITTRINNRATIMTTMKKIFVFVFRMLKIIRQEIRTDKSGFLFLKPTIDWQALYKMLTAGRQKTDSRWIRIHLQWVELNKNVELNIDHYFFKTAFRIYTQPLTKTLTGFVHTVNWYTKHGSHLFWS